MGNREHDGTRDHLRQARGENNILIGSTVLSLTDANKTWPKSLQRYKTPANRNASKLTEVQIS